MTEPNARAVVEERWRTITTDVQQFVEDGASWSQVNSKAWIALDDALEYLAARIVGEVRDRLSTEGDTSPVSEMQSVVSGLHDHIEAAILAWAEPIVAADLARRAASRAGDHYAGRPE